MPDTAETSARLTRIAVYSKTVSKRVEEHYTGEEKRIRMEAVSRLVDAHRLHAVEHAVIPPLLTWPTTQAMQLWTEGIGASALSGTISAEEVAECIAAAFNFPASDILLTVIPPAVEWCILCPAMARGNVTATVALLCTSGMSFHAGTCNMSNDEVYKVWRHLEHAYSSCRCLQYLLREHVIGRNAWEFFYMRIYPSGMESGCQASREAASALLHGGEPSVLDHFSPVVLPTPAILAVADYMRLIG
jgi:hypothetical protein